MSESNLQKKARARANLKRQLTNGNLVIAINKAFEIGAVSFQERILLDNIKTDIETVINKWFDNTKRVGLKAKRRCTLCGRIAKYKVIYPTFESYRCTKCIEFEDKLGTYQEINPND